MLAGYNRFGRHGAAHRARENKGDADRFPRTVRVPFVFSDADSVRVLLSQGGTYFFHVPDRKTAGELVGNMRGDNAIIRLLDLGLLRYDYSHEDAGMRWAYHWTYLGRLVLREFGLVLPPLVQST
jgi:hypothetical protein